jgi:hypothetical protein
MPGALYTDSGWLEVVNPEPGEYRILVSRLAGASDEDVYSVRVELEGHTTVLADKARVDTLPQTGFSFVSTANRPPAPDAGSDITVEASGAATPVLLDASQSVDPDGDQLSFEWRGPFGRMAGVTPTIELPVGVHFVEVLATDTSGHTSSDATAISIVDTRYPDVTPPGPISLWTANAAGVRAADDAALAIFLGGGVAADLVDPAPTRLNAQVEGVDATGDTWFPVGTTIVTFRFRDAFDNVGTASSTVTVALDSTPPSITAARTPAPNANGWNNSVVTVTFVCSDSLSSVVQCGPSPKEASGEGAGQMLDGIAMDEAGNTSTAAVTNINIDKTGPQVRCPVADDAWHADNATLRCEASDGLSGIVDPPPSLLLKTSVPPGTETGVAATGSVTVCDRADNCATAGPIAGNKIDRKPPTVSITSPTQTVYTLNQQVASSYLCADGGSGIASCTGPVPSGANVPTATTGSHTFTVAAADNVGNTSSESISYTVAYNVCPLYDQTKAVKSGATIPIKLQLCDAASANVSAPTTVLTAVRLVQVSGAATGEVEDAGNANPDDGFRYDASLGGYIFNLKTTGLATGTWKLEFTAGGDGLTHAVQFQVR